MPFRKLIAAKAEHDAYIALCRKLGRTILTYKAPCCGKSLEGIAALPEETWDTGATCPICGRTYWKHTTSTEIVATLLPTAKAA